MLSDFRDDSSIFGISLSASHADSGDAEYYSSSLGLRVRPLEWLQVTASVPYTRVKGKEIIWDQPTPGVDRKNVFAYDERGLGDIVLMGWVNVLYPFLADRSTPADSQGRVDDLSEMFGSPSLFFGAGAKLDTGTHEEWSMKKYNFDRSKATTGEFSDSDGMLPARFQLGTGTTDPLLGLVYQQRIGRVVPTAGVSYQVSGGENSIGYERSDRFSWSLGAKYILINHTDCRQLYLYGGASGSYILDDDVDHSEDTTTLGSQERGSMEDTKGGYYFGTLSLGYDITENLTVSGAYTLPLDDQDSDSEYSFDHQISLSLRFSF